MSPLITNPIKEAFCFFPIFLCRLKRNVKHTMRMQQTAFFALFESGYELYFRAVIGSVMVLQILFEGFICIGITYDLFIGRTIL